MNKTIVKVECHINESGAVVPKSITWHDGRKWDIARVVHSCASYDGEFEGIRYTVLIGSAEKYLYRLGSQWYVDSGYGKSFSNNYLEQKRVNNHDSSTYMCVKSDFEPIVSEEEWYKCQEIKAKRVKQTMSAANTANKQKRHHGTKENRDLWGSKLQCSCGHSFRKNRWHKNNNMPWSYGYQCYNQLNNGSAASRRKAGVDDTGYCDQPMIADWKLDLMAKFIFERIWIDKNEVISKTCDLINECYRADVPKKVNLTGVASQIEKYRAKKNTLLDMRTDGEITKEEFAVQKQKIDAVLADLENEYASMLQSEQEIRVPDLRWDEIKETLTQVLDFSQPQVNPDLIRKFVSKIVPDGKNHFRWYMNLDGHDTTSLDVVTEGRKSNAVVTFDSGGDKPPLHTGDVITISQLKEKKSSTLSILRRLHLLTKLEHSLINSCFRTSINDTKPPERICFGGCCVFRFMRQTIIFLVCPLVSLIWLYYF